MSLVGRALPVYQKQNIENWFINKRHDCDSQFPRKRKINRTKQFLLFGKKIVFRWFGSGTRIAMNYVLFGCGTVLDTALHSDLFRDDVHDTELLSYRAVLSRFRWMWYAYEDMRSEIWKFLTNVTFAWPYIIGSGNGFSPKQNRLGSDWSTTSESTNPNNRATCSASANVMTASREHWIPRWHWQSVKNHNSAYFVMRFVCSNIGSLVNCHPMGDKVYF